MIRAACHCTAVRFEISESPSWVLDCNCTLCRRYAGLWSYYFGADHAKLLSAPAPELTDAYRWLDGEIGFHRCKACGCVTHLTGADDVHVHAVNARLIPTLDPGKVVVIQANNSHTGWFWTRSDRPVRESHHPVMPIPTAEDWR